MLFQDTLPETPPETPELTGMEYYIVFAFIVGMLVACIIMYSYRQFNKRLERLKMPVTLIIDLISWRLYNVGMYIRISHDISIPVQDQATMKLWGVVTSNFLVIPSYGHEDDVILIDRSFQRVVVMICQLIGLSKDGPEVHAQWCKDVFPPDIYDVPQELKEVPDNYIFVRPVGPRSIVRGALRSKLNMTRQMYASRWKIIMKYEQQLEEALSHNDTHLMQMIQRQNEVYLSCWTNMLDVYDVILRERPTTLYVMARLLHIPQSNLAYSSLNTAMSHGGMADASKYAHALTNTLQSLSKSLGMTMVSTPIHKGMMLKAQQQMSELEESRATSNQMKMQLLQTLAQQANQHPKQAIQANPQNGTATNERRV